MKVMIVVTHLLGTGHLARALTLARAMQTNGDDVVVVSGGVRVPLLDQEGVHFVQLPPVRSDGVNFSVLLDESGQQVSQAHFEARKSLLIQTLTSHRPDVLITELFPFGRRILKDEFLALLRAANDLPKRPVISASIRDILAPPSKPQKAQATHEMIAQYFDCVLVHSDADLMPLNLSWPVTKELNIKLRYTGFVAPSAPSPHPEKIGIGEIIVSAGGGNVGVPLFECAIQVAKMRPELRFRALVGGSQSETICAQLNDAAPSNFRAEPARPDFRQMLNHADASVSLCGYNTALDILQTGCPAVFLPFDDGNEVEQSVRAQALARQSGIRAIRNANLAPETLATAIAQVMNDKRRAPLKTSVDGASQARAILHDLVMARQ